MKIMLQKLMPLALALLTISCHSKPKNDKMAETVVSKTEETKTEKQKKDLSQFETAYFASGCFWCVEAIYESVEGVEEVISGYSGGKEKNPTYKQVSYGKTTHAEAVEVYYDPKVVSFETLVTVFFGSHDPTTLNRQGPDRGAQYRSIAFYKNDSEKQIIEAFIKGLEEAEVYPSKIVTQVKRFKKFYKAEDYHQDYEKLNPGNRYVQQVSVPRLNRFKERFPQLLKKEAH
ncbi:peptide-methionine (S)-S-oxide reductase MsrA [Sediminicola luteus]|uniref:Peptide methionine sulfoxide reductase MsrA n=1 Tax=Sediminicola luteus TaxID=319238 RepID=A0A2A4GAR4_9FLAO|nr:peptide-methionine (S)-S-oxide reductase MsrA [Sediminicola luteus]PCE65076.1 peptide-methionine (S)-S-oxide reductase [Sediminicola luteus]